MIAEAAPRVRPLDLCDAVGLNLAQLQDVGARIPLRQLVMLYEAAARLTRDRTFGLRVGSKTEFRNFDLLGYIIMNSATLGDALHNAVRYFALWTSGAGFHLDQDGRAVRFIFEYADPSIAEWRQDCEMTLLAAAKIRCLLHAHHLRPREVHFQHSAPRDPFTHRLLFGTSVYFRMPANQLVFDRRALESPLSNADRELGNLLIAYANDLIAKGGDRLSLTDHANIALRRSLLNGGTRLTTVAHKLGMSSRNLQRQLTMQGTSFRGLVAELRRELAGQYLQQPELEISEIAYLLGYTQPSEFHRAFRSWTGTTPRRYRRPTVVLREGDAKSKLIFTSSLNHSVS